MLQRAFFQSQNNEPCPLDIIPEANIVAAYSNRRLRSNYVNGFANKTRKSSDSSLYNLGFLQNDFDAAALATNIGANTGYIDSWYDQGPNGYHVFNTATANQPRIRNSGTDDTINGKSVIQGTRANSSNLGTGTISNLLTGTQMTLIVVCTSNAQGAYSYDRYVSAMKTGGEDNQDGGFNLTNANTANTMAIVAGNNQYLYAGNSTGNVSGNVVVSVRRNGTSYEIKVNNGLTATATFPSTAFNVNRLGLFAHYGGSNHVEQKMGDTILLNVAISDAELKYILDNMGRHYGISIS